MDRVAIDARSVDAGLGKFVFPLLVALVDEDIVVDSARQHVKLGVCNVPGGELGVVLGRRLGVAGADRDVGRNRELPQPGCIHAEGLDNSGRHRKYGLDALVVYVERRRRIEGSSLRRWPGTIGLLRQPCWKARYFSGSTLAPPTHSAVKPPCEWPATPMRLASIRLPQNGSSSRKLMLSAMSRGRCQSLLARYAIVAS